MNQFIGLSVIDGSLSCISVSHYGDLTMSNQQELLAANEAFYRCFEKKNLETLAEICSHGASTICIHPGRNALRGWENIRNSWAQIFKNTNYLEIETEIISVEVIGNLGYVVLIEKLFQVVRGRKLAAQSMATNIFEYMGGKWYLIHHHGSPIMK
jgi:ketosteroid isomerase-like protein